MALKPAAQRVQDALLQRGFEIEVRELDRIARSAAEAAAAIGCRSPSHWCSGAEQVVAPCWSWGSGAHRVDLGKVEALLGALLEKPGAEFVRDETGFAIGGVPPIGHGRPLTTFIDEDLLRHEVIWAAAGHRNAVFSSTPAMLLALTGGKVTRTE